MNNKNIYQYEKYKWHCVFIHPLSASPHHNMRQSLPRTHFFQYTAP